jgi:hypothetical protein
MNTIKRRAVIRWCVLTMLALPLASCGEPKADVKLLELTLDHYASVMRFGSIGQAVSFLDPEVAKDKPLSRLDMERYEQVEFSNYRAQPVVMVPPDRARQVVQLSITNRHTQIVREMVDMQEWRFDAAAKRWWLVSGLPDITKAQ